jgi:hypothetical protein
MTYIYLVTYIQYVRPNLVVLVFHFYVRPKLTVIGQISCQVKYLFAALVYLYHDSYASFDQIIFELLIRPALNN